MTAALIAVIGVCALIAGPSALLAWLLMLGLGGLGVNVAFLPLWAIVFVVGCIIGGARQAA